MQEHRPNSTEQFLPVESIDQATRSLVDDVSSVVPGGNVYIFSGESNPDVYGSPLFIDAVENVLGRNSDTRINVLTSPVLVSETNSHPLLDLKDKYGERFNLKHRVVRGVDMHFRVVETENDYLTYLEFPHHPLDANRQHANRDFKGYRGDGSLLNVFNAWMNNPNMTVENPLLVKSGDLRQLLQAHYFENGQFNYVTQNGFLSKPEAREVLRYPTK